jgi:hypothetical protein
MTEAATVLRALIVAVNAGILVAPRSMLIRMEGAITAIESAAGPARST